ncbi:hypothetical protein BLNAU_20206 [Blattamonas nauphoetae]|uniref:Uncharacterized protein n=1 Tax=Blattamonas nauphoetae TaxID=2049346 RepID=A0ABQ9WZW7_9EUKA|nr:hypothetical protein BLNAU_20206 [Blattamonas nauphoetae]
MRDEEQQMNKKTDSLQQICEDESNRMFDEAEKEIEEIEDYEDRKRRELDSERLSEEEAETDKITELQKGQEDLFEHVIEETMNELGEREEDRPKEEGERQEQQLDEKRLKEKQLMKEKGGTNSDHSAQKEELIALLQKVRDIDAKVTELEENNQEVAILLQVLEEFVTSMLSDPFLTDKRDRERRRNERTEDTILAMEHGDKQGIEPDTLADSKSDEEYSLMDLDDETSTNVSAVDAQMDLDERNERKHDFRFIIPQKDKHKETGTPGDPFGGNYVGPDSEGLDDLKPCGEGSELDWENSSIIDANPLPLFTSPVNVTFTEEKMMWLREPFLLQDERKEMFTKKTRRVLNEEGTRLNDEQQTQLTLQLGTKAIHEKKEHIISARDEGVGNIKQTINTRVAKTDERLERYCKAGEERAYQAAIGD